MIASRFAPIALLIVAISAVEAQQLLTSEFLGEESALELQARYGMEFRSGIDLYKLTYLTTGSDNLPDTASGLAVIPKTPYKNTVSVVAYQHGTTNGPEDVPSLLEAGSDEARAYGGMGYYVSAADYLGLGESRGFHPYVHRETQARAGTDMIHALMEFIENEIGETSADHLFVSGYSQGGHAAMALAQDLQENGGPDLEVRASTPMSGPYDISGTMLDLITGDQVYLFSGFLAYTILGYQEVYGNIYEGFEDVFKPPYIPGVEAFYNEEINLTELTAFLLAQLVLQNGLSIPRLMLQDSFIDGVTNNPDHPMRIALRDNDTYNWSPEHPMRLYYCMADEQVPFENSIVADSIFEEAGAADVVAIDIDPDLDHGGCAIPAIQTSIDFFDGFVTQVSTQDAVIARPSQIAFPNPASDAVRLSVASPSGIERMTLVSISGKQVRSWKGSQELLNLSGLAPGIYLLSAYTTEHIYYQKLVVE